MTGWRSLDDVFNEPRTARPGNEVTSWMAEFFDQPDPAADRALDRQINAMLGLGGNALSSPDREVRKMMSVDPGSFRMGPPGARRRVERRPLKLLVDDWLAAGGWYGGADTAGSVALSEADSKSARESLQYRWRSEIAARGWEGRWFRKEIREDGGEVRMYWRTMPQRAPVGPPVLGEWVLATREKLDGLGLDGPALKRAQDTLTAHLLIRHRDGHLACVIDGEPWVCAAMRELADATGIVLPTGPYDPRAQGRTG